MPNGDVPDHAPLTGGAATHFSFAPRSHFARHVLVNMALAVVIDLGLHALHDRPIVQDAENAGIDATIRFFGLKGADHTAEPWVAFAVLDIDDDTWQAWESPNVVPRDKLLRIMEFAVDASPEAVVVDLDLTVREGANGRQASGGDSALAAFLQHHKGPTPILLAKRLDESIRKDNESKPTLPQPRRAWFEPIPDSAAAWVRWGTVSYFQDRDGLVRRWRLWEPVCAANTPGAIPSIQLLAAASLDTQVRMTGLRDFLTEVTPPSCLAESHDPGEPTLELWGHTIASHADPLSQRIVYSLTWPPAAESTPMVQLRDARLAPMLLRIPAHRITESSQPLSSEALAGRIVVIGSSHAESRDWYATPLGQLPGFMIIVNSMASLRSHGQLGESHGPLRWTVTLLLMLVGSVAYARYHPLMATFLLTPLIYVAVAPISFYLFGTAVWLDFTAPVLGMQLHELIAGAESAWKQRGRRDPDQRSLRGDRAT